MLAIAYGNESSIRKGKDGEENLRCLVWTDTWLKREGKWQIIAAQDTAVPCRKSPMHNLKDPWVPAQDMPRDYYLQQALSRLIQWDCPKENIYCPAISRIGIKP